MTKDVGKHGSATVRRTLTVAQAAKVVGWGRNKGYQAARDGTLPTIRHGKRLVVPEAALDRWLAEAGRM